MHGTPPRKKIWPPRAARRRPVSISILGRKKPRLGEPAPNLSTHRWHHSLPSPERDAELVRLAKAGDKRASRELVTNYHRLVLECVRKHRVGYLGYKKHRGTYKYHTNGATDDAIGRGFEGLWRAVLNYEPHMGPFSAYARSYIKGYASKETKDFVKRGSSGETRIERWLFSHPKATPEELAAAFDGLDTSEAETEIQQFKARCTWQRHAEPDEGDDENRHLHSFDDKYRK
jgi:hypothetical protein